MATKYLYMFTASMAFAHKKSICWGSTSLVHRRRKVWPGHFSGGHRRFISYIAEGMCLITGWPRTNVEEITACYGNNIGKLTAWVNPVFPNSKFMLLTCIMQTLPLITHSSCVESALRIRRVSVSVFHLVNSRKYCRILVMLLYTKLCEKSLLFLPIRYIYSSTWCWTFTFSQLSK